jgi:lipoprotein NlpD
VQPIKGADSRPQPIKPLEKPSPVAAAPEAPVSAESVDTETAQLAAQLNLRWPAEGDIVATFDDKTNKGIGIAGQLGDPIVAAADGRVVYAGSGLRGYGNLVILKHDDTFLTAYAHNQSLAVREDQVVKKGDKIAQMGSSDADRVKLHFEVRRLGKPVDPIAFLPKR